VRITCPLCRKGNIYLPSDDLQGLVAVCSRCDRAIKVRTGNVKASVVRSSNRTIVTLNLLNVSPDCSVLLRKRYLDLEGQSAIAIFPRNGLGNRMPVSVVVNDQQYFCPHVQYFGGRDRVMLVVVALACSLAMGTFTQAKEQTIIVAIGSMAIASAIRYGPKQKRPDLQRFRDEQGFLQNMDRLESELGGLNRKKAEHQALLVRMQSIGEGSLEVGIHQTAAISKRGIAVLDEYLCRIEQLIACKQKMLNFWGIAFQSSKMFEAFPTDFDDIVTELSHQEDFLKEQLSELTANSYSILSTQLA
jgi:hypothetical protein